MTPWQAVQIVFGVVIGLPLLAIGVVNGEGITMLIGLVMVGLCAMAMRESA